MFRKKSPQQGDNEATPESTRQPLTDSNSGVPLAAKETPGYFRGFYTLSQQKFWDATTRALIQNRISRSIPIRFFSPEQTLTMAAVVDRILPQEDRIPSRRIDILPGIDERLFENRLEGYRYDDMPSDQDAYRMAARAFEEMAQELYDLPFHELPTLDQERLIQSIHDAKPQAAENLWKKMNVERFWAMLVSDCCSVYYAHPYAWDEVGFGGPAYPRGYMRLEEGEPEPWEVDEQRYEWAAPADTLSDKEEASGDGAGNQSRPGQAGTH